MKTQKTLFFREVFLISFIVISYILCSFILFPQAKGATAIDIHLHDTYFVVQEGYIFFFVFLLTAYVISCIRVYRYRFVNFFANTTLVITGILSVMALSLLFRLLLQFSFFGFTIYPPLSGLGPDYISGSGQFLVIKILTYFFLVIQFIVLTSLIWLSYKMGIKNRDKY